MSDHIETPEEIQDEMEELGIDNDSTGSPDLFISGPVVQAGAVVLVLLLVAGMLVLVF